MSRRARSTILLLLVTFLVSTFVGPLLDQIHVIGGALWYANPWLFDQAWWVAPQFGLAFAGIAGAALAIQYRLGRPDPEPTSSVRALQQFTWFLAAYAVTGVAWEHPWLVVVLLGAALAVRLAYERPDMATIRTIVLLSLVGWSYEAVLSSIPGTFSYVETGGAPAPVWLPLLYAHAAPLVRTFMKNATHHLSRAD